ncbi:MAG: hypothetical protein IKJ94_05020 [Oscillospiraceae bacterium]|nr:hypothetical protein [Oscillospiraceae bacterium]
MALTDKLAAIGDALRRNLDSDEKVLLADMPGEIDRVYRKAISDFWAQVPTGMDRYHFAGDGWNVDNFYPQGRFTCASGNPQYVFAYHNRRHAPYDLAQRLEDCGAEIVFTGASKIDFGFYGANITALPALDFSNMTRLQATFSGCGALQTVRELKLGEATEYSQAFAGCVALENLTVSGTIGQNGFDVSECPLTVQSLRSILAALKPGASKTLTLGAENLAKLTQAELAAAAEAGWSVV